MKSNARLLLSIQVLAGFAQWIDIFLIFSVPSFVWKSSPTEIAILASLFGVPSLFLGPIIGAFLDRSDPRHLMLWGGGLRTVLSVLIAFVPWFNVFAMLVFAKGLANILYWPASSLVTNQAIPESARLPYFAGLSALDQFAKIFTPMLAGLLATIFPSQLVFLGSAAATLICVLALPSLFARLEFNRAASAARTVSGLVSALLEGFVAVKTLPRGLLLTIGLSIGMSLVLAVYDPHMAAFLGAKGFDATVFSLIVSSTAAGAVTAAGTVRLLWKNSAAERLIRIGVGLFCMAVVLAAIVMECAPEILGKVLFMLLWFINGFGYELFVIGSRVNMQNLCPQLLLGRVSTSVRSMQMTAIVLGPSIGAWLIAQHGRNAPFVFSAYCAPLLLAAAIAWGQSKTELRERGRP